jgi:S1/P1 Nuclease
MKQLQALLCACVLLVCTHLGTPAKAWGELGHLTVCDLAYRNLTKTARDELKVLFNAGNGGIQVGGSADREPRRYTSFNVGCLEEDERPRTHPKDHFLNVSRDTTTIPTDVCPVTASGSPTNACIFGGIRRDLGILGDRQKSKEARVIALMAVGHWIGDLHQPLHVSYKDDAGGNAINVSVNGSCGTSSYRAGNLHAVWDNCLLQAGLFERVRKRIDFKPSWGRRTITYRAVDTLLANTTLSEERRFVATPMESWAEESFEITRRPETEYCVMVGTTCQYSETQDVFREDMPERVVRIDQAYRDRFKGVAEERVRRAGFRLAHLVNKTLDPNYREPTQ